MEVLVTLESLKNWEGQKSAKFPPDTIVTKEARIYAAKHGIDIYIGEEKLPEPTISRTIPAQKAVISVIGEDKVGIIAAVSEVLAKNQVNILDITQTAIQGLFAMIMVVDIARASCSFDELKSALSKRGQELCVRIDAQREEVFHFMHRI